MATRERGEGRHEEEIWSSVKSFFKFISDSMGLNWVLKDEGNERREEKGNENGENEKRENRGSEGKGGEGNEKTGEGSGQRNLEEDVPLRENIFDAIRKKYVSCPEPYSFILSVKRRELQELAERIKKCTLCELHKGRKNAVPGEGDPESPVMFVGEAPGYDEDRRGRPFVGKSGRLLRQKIKEILGLDPSKVYITNVVRCRPPENRTPHPDEIEKCKKYLMTEIAIVKPKLVVCLGNISAKVILNTDEKITSLRGTFFPKSNYTVFAMFHPAFVVRNPAKMPVFEEDMKKIKEFLEGKRKVGGEEEKEDSG